MRTAFLLLLGMAFNLGSVSAQYRPVKFAPGDTVITTGVRDTFVGHKFFGLRCVNRPSRFLRISLDSFSSPYYTKSPYNRIEPARRQGDYWFLGSEGSFDPESAMLPLFVGYSGFVIHPAGPNIPAELPSVGDQAFFTRMGGGKITFTFSSPNDAVSPTGEKLRVERGIFTPAICGGYEFSKDEASGLEYFAWRDSGDCRLTILGWLEFPNRPKVSDIPGPHATDQERLIATFGKQVWEPVTRTMALDSTTAITAVVNGKHYPIYLTDVDGGRFYSYVKPGEYFINYSLTLRTGEESHQSIEVDYWGDEAKRLDHNIELHFEADGKTLRSNTVEIFIGNKKVL